MFVTQYGNQDYRKVLPDHPFIEVNKWEDFNPNGIDINKKQAEVHAWYHNYLRVLKEDVKKQLVSALS